MSARATHPCDACGGTSFRAPLTEMPAWTQCYCGHAAHVHDRYGCMFRNFSPDGSDGCSCVGFGSANFACPVCLGEGSFPDRMPARDALADAETLRRVAWDTFPSTRWFEIHGEDGVEARANVLQNGLLGRDSKTGALLPPTGVARWTASLAARAAFRAVPGLRGEE